MNLGDVERLERAEAARDAAAAAGGLYVEPEHLEALARLSAAPSHAQTLRLVGYVRSLVDRWQAGRVTT